MVRTRAAFIFTYRPSVGQGTYISVWQTSKPDYPLRIVSRRFEQVVLGRDETARGPDLDERGSASSDFGMAQQATHAYGGSTHCFPSRNRIAS